MKRETEGRVASQKRGEKEERNGRKQKEGKEGETEQRKATISVLRIMEHKHSFQSI